MGLVHAPTVGTIDATEYASVHVFSATDDGVSMTRRTSANATTTSTTAVDLYTWPVVLNGVYTLDAYLRNQSSLTTAGPRYAIGGAATSAATLSPVDAFLEMSTAATTATKTDMVASGTLYGTNVGAATTTFQSTIHGSFVCTVAGNAALRWAMSAAGTATQVRGAYAVLTRIG